METDSGDNNDFANAAVDGFVPIRIETNGIKFDQELIEEYANKEGDMDIICRGGEKLRCHSCVISCQSKIMRRSIARNTAENVEPHLNCTKFSLTTMSKLMEIMYCSDASFDYANEMIEILLAAAYYNIPWVVAAVQKATVNFCTRAEDSITGANRCRDILLILQENVTFTVDRPNPTYAPFDPSLQTLTDELIARMQDYARKGVVPNEADPLRIANIVHDYLEQEPQDRQIGRDDSMMKYISFYYADIALVDKNDIFHGIIRRNSVLQNLLIGIIPDMAPANNPPPPPPPDNPPAPPAPSANNALPPRHQRRDPFGGWARRFGRNDPLNWMHPEDEPEQIQQQRAIERRMEQRRAEQRRLEQRLADQEERARQSREHIRQARDVMRREMQLQQQRVAAVASTLEKATTSQEKISKTKKKGNKEECEAWLKSDCPHQRRMASQMIADKLARYRAQFEQKRYNLMFGPNAASHVAEMEKMLGKVRQLLKMMNDVPVGKRLEVTTSYAQRKLSHSALTSQINQLITLINNAIRRASLLELPFPLPHDANPTAPMRTLSIATPAFRSTTHREGPETKKRRVDASTQKDAEKKKTATTIKQEPGTSGGAAAPTASGSSSAAAQQPNAAEQAWIAISDSDESDEA